MTLLDTWIILIILTLIYVLKNDNNAIDKEN